MLGLVHGYLVLMGTLGATVQVVRGVVRGAGKLIEGDGRGALAEVAGGLLAPARSLYCQVCLLGQEVCESAGAIAPDETAPELPLIRLPRLRRRRGAEMNGAPAADPAAAQ